MALFNVVSKRKLKYKTVEEIKFKNLLIGILININQACDKGDKIK